MNRSSLFLIAALIPGILGPQPAGPRQEIRLEGQVTNGQPFDREIGKGLVLSLRPGTYADGHQLGWDITVHPKGLDEDFAACVTYEQGHGLNPNIMIYAWYFVDPQTGKIIDASFIAKFRFTTSLRDQKRACRNARLKGKAGYASADLGQGSLRIVDMRGGMRNGRPVIDGFRFSAVITFPSKGDSR